ncbi:MAG: hypothetical protein IPN94_09220 [Sphingobacteriales bacterium]|nr:hypothetical protein [Sphingobacteriales bacterium]
MAETMLALEIGEKYFEDFMKKNTPLLLSKPSFAYYACFPFVFSPDMLYQLWLNFQDYKKDGKLQLLPMVVVSDLLQSGFCQEVAFELYELNGELAAYLNRNIKKISEDRELVLLYSHKDIAVFTLSYAEQYLQHPNRRNLYNIYYWKSLLKPTLKKQASIQDALNANSTDTDAAIFLQLPIAKPLTNTPNPQEDYNKLPFFLTTPIKIKP